MKNGKYINIRNCNECPYGQTILIHTPNMYGYKIVMCFYGSKPGDIKFRKAEDSHILPEWCPLEEEIREVASNYSKNLGKDYVWCVTTITSYDRIEPNEKGVKKMEYAWRIKNKDREIVNQVLYKTKAACKKAILHYAKLNKIKLVEKQELENL